MDNKLYRLLLFFVLAIYCYYIVHCITNGWFLYNEDETIYFDSARLFAETNSVKSPNCIDEAVSRVLGTGWYGPFFHIFYGSIAKIVGNYTLTFFLVNIVSLSLAAWLIAITACNYSILATFCLLSLPPLIDLAFSFFPEVLILLFGLIIVVAWIQAYKATNGHIKRNILIFVLFVWFFALFRVTLIFWIIGLWFLSKNKKQSIIYTLVIAASAFYVLIYMKYFTAPPYADGMRALDLLYKLDFIGFINAVFHKFYFNFYVFKADLGLNKALLLFMFFFLIMQHIRNNGDNKLMKYVGAVSAVYIMAILMLYTTESFNITKQTLVLFPGIILAIEKDACKSSRLFFALSLFAFMLLSLPYTTALMQVRSKCSHYYNVTYLDLRRSFQEIAATVDPNKENLVLWSYDEWDYPSRTADVLIPMNSRYKKPILYTSHVVPREAGEEMRFKQLGVQKIDYVLSRYPLLNENLTLVLRNNHLSLYKNGK